MIQRMVNLIKRVDWFSNCLLLFEYNHQEGVGNGVSSVTNYRLSPCPVGTVEGKRENLFGAWSNNMRQVLMDTGIIFDNQAYFSYL